MQTELRKQGDSAYFVVTDLPPALHEAARRLAYGEVPGGWGLAVPATTPKLDTIYANWARSVEVRILQRAGLQPVPWEQALHALLDHVEGQEIDWWLTGSGALTARGLDVTPGDLDLTVNDADGAHRLALVLREHLVEPLQPRTGWAADWFARAFLGACIDWVGVPNDNFGVADFGPTAARQLETISWHGREIRVPPLALQRDVNLHRGRTERAAQIERWIANQP